MLNQKENLYDEVCTIMKKAYLDIFARRNIKISDSVYESAVPFNVCGMKGFVDLAEYPASSLEPLNLYKFEPQIISLKELLTGIKSQLEFFPQYLNKEKKMEHPEFIQFFLVLLNTERNLDIVRNNYDVFKTVLPEIIFPNDIISKNISPDDERFHWRMRKLQIIFFNPLMLSQLKQSDCIFTEKGKTENRVLSFIPIEVTATNKSELLGIIEPPFKNHQDFFEKYRKYIAC